MKWSDVDFFKLTIEINRSIFQGVLGNCKTEASGKLVPLSLNVAADLWLWKERSAYSKPEDWIFASPWAKGRKPYWPNTLLRKIIRPAAVRAGIKKRIGWHTFRHTYSTMLIANGENVKVVQEPKTREQPLHTGYLYASENSSETIGPTTSCANDSAEERLSGINTLA